jgi:predicted HAD superfamily Cof-like phosphohydrolase
MQRFVDAVSTFNRVMGATRYRSLRELLADAKTLKLRIGLCTEECSEMTSAWFDLQKHGAELCPELKAEVLDGLGDLVYVAAGLADVAAINLADCVDVPHDAPKGSLEAVTDPKSDSKCAKKVESALEHLTGLLDITRDSLESCPDLYGSLESAVRYAIALLIRRCAEMANECGWDLDAAFDLIHASNMSKVCRDQATAERTVANYIATEDKHPYRGVAYRTGDPEIGIGEYFVVYDGNGKILKSIDYAPVNLTGLV